MKLFKFIVIILSIFFAVSYGIQFFHTALNFDIQQSSEKFFLIGLAVFLPFWFIWLRRSHFYSTFEHEFTHLIVGLLFFKKPSHFTATESDGGVTGMYGNNFVITLAPYFLPTFVYLLLPLYLVIDVKFYQYYFAVLGFLTAYHLLSTWQEFGFHQTDITKSGKVFSCIFLTFANIFIYGILLAFVIGRFQFCWTFIKGGFLGSIDWVMWVVNLVKGLIAG
ncbi:MAG: hypothetical protein Q7J16_03510 [Candidatus Cloacimonadales bacterium]|nr:hypothetical protein [Candidatus Cloacimonadales bacterium]